MAEQQAFRRQHHLRCGKGASLQYSNSDGGGHGPRVLVFYHYLHPDDVVSALHFTELCVGLRERECQITAVSCNRGCRDEAVAYPSDSVWQGVRIHRIWRPPARQSTLLGRFFNSAWMILAWSSLAFRHPSPDLLVIGSDPVLSILVAVPWKLVRPATRIVHWCHDLYPEAAVAEGLIRPNHLLARVLRVALASAYRACDLIVDIGSCMRERLLAYNSPARHVTLTPWALAEPTEPLPRYSEERNRLFGNARLALLYSGNFGRAHCHEKILALARQMRPANARFVFSVRGNRVEALRSSVTAQDDNIRFVPFASQNNLEARLGAADVHVVSLREEWTGTVVPSKFFGSLAVGRPVLFAGSADAAVARWIREHNVGWVLTGDNVRSVAEELQSLSGSPEQLTSLFSRCHQVYQRYFSKEQILGLWHTELTTLLDGRRRAN